MRMNMKFRDKINLVIFYWILIEVIIYLSFSLSNKDINFMGWTADSIIAFGIIFGLISIIAVIVTMVFIADNNQ